MINLILFLFLPYPLPLSLTCFLCERYLIDKNNALTEELQQLKMKMLQSQNNPVPEILNVNPKTQNEPNKKLKYTLYIFALIIAVASIAIGFCISHYVFLGLIISLILLFIVCCLNSKSQEEKNFKSINNNLSCTSQNNIVKRRENIIEDNEISIIDNNDITVRNNENEDEDILNNSF